MKFPDDFFERDGLWFPKDSDAVIDYTDGETVEAYLETTLAQARDLSSLSSELQGKAIDWPSRYHLSSERSNLLRGLELAAGARILELGAGCGAITRYMLECGGEVTAVEGSPSRARLCQLRCRDLNRGRILVGDFFKVELEERFDLVTLIGVLEYAGVYRREASDPWLELIERATARLRPGGQLLIAIENQFGLKYFSGCGEDHGLARFSSIEGYPDEIGVRTFGRAALQGLVRRAGLDPSFLILPFPDYKIPSSLVNAEYCDPERAVRLGLSDWCRKPFEDYSRPRDYLFDDHLALRELAGNGLLPELSNSFLLVARKGSGEAPPLAAPAWVARRLNTTRHPTFRTDTVLTVDTDGAPQVQKKRLDPGIPLTVDAGLVTHVLEPEPYVAGAESMSLAMVRALRQHQGAEEAYALLLGEWLAFFTEEHAAPGHTDRLRGEFVDCVPDNLLRHGGSPWVYIDREWRFSQPVSLDWVFYRGLVGVWAHHALAIAGATSRELEARERFICRSFELLGSPISVATLGQLEHWEREFQHVVHSGPGAKLDAPMTLRGSAPAPWQVPGRQAVVQGTGLRLLG